MFRRTDISRVDLVPERRTDGTVALRAVVHGPAARLRELFRRLGLARV